ncbi:MAG: hypothetical protein Kow00121_01980 [Elainellaceae cyanobacterium]
MALFSHQQILVLGAVGIFALAGCSTSANQTKDSATSPSSTTVAQQDTTTGFDGLLTVITNTKAAVAAGEFSKAQAEFDRFEEFWSQVEDGVKVKSADTYNAIEDNMDQVSNELRASQPNPDKLLTALQTLQNDINAARL